jgi:predicted ester cyclase
MPETTTDDLKVRINQFFADVWGAGNLDALPDFWAENCVNHGAPEGSQNGLAAIRGYHEGFLTLYSTLSEMGLGVNRQIAEGDTVVTHMTTTGKHSGDFLGFSATGRTLSVDTMRIDRFENGKIIEHWSVTDMAGLMSQLQG